MASDQRPGPAGGNPMFPLDESRITSASSLGTPAGLTIAALGGLKAGWYWVTVGTSVDASGTSYSNLALYKNDDRVGVISSYDGELECWVRLDADSGEISVRLIAADASIRYFVDNLTATRYLDITGRGRC